MTDFKNNKQSGMSSLKLILIIALGILMASFIGCVATFMFTSAVITGIGTAISNSQGNSIRSPSNSQPLHRLRILEPNTININPTTSNQKQLTNEELAQQIKQLEQDLHKEQSKGFKSQYKKPKECYEMKDKETRVFCANNYMRAQTAFEKVN